MSSNIPQGASHAVRRFLRTHPDLKRAAVAASEGVGMLRHSLWKRFPGLIRAIPAKITVAITSACNLRCVGCRYGRDFMPGSQLSLQMVKDMLDDGRQAGVDTVRLYGGEPLLHRDLPAMVRHAVGLGLSTYVTTNGILLGEKIDELHDAGLRALSVGFYGVGPGYDAYVQKKDRFVRLERSLARVRERHGSSVGMQLNFLIMRPSCSVGSLLAAWRYVERYDMTLHTDLIHYSLPYFTEGPDKQLQFTGADRPALEELVAELVRLKRSFPNRIPESEMSLRSIPDWAFDRQGMRIPCDAYKLIWIGADGTVKLCYVTFELGNLHERRLRDMIGGSVHDQAAKDAFLLNCPGCHCERDSRIAKDFASRMKYR